MLTLHGQISNERFQVTSIIANARGELMDFPEKDSLRAQHATGTIVGAAAWPVLKTRDYSFCNQADSNQNSQQPLIDINSCRHIWSGVCVSVGVGKDHLASAQVNEHWTFSNESVTD